MKKIKTNPEVAETPETTFSEPVHKAVNKVGSLLKEMRLQKGLRLPDVAKKLCIRRMYLEAIEESNYKEIPQFPYGVGFIRSYADYLGLNSSNIVELYKEETNTAPDKNIYVLEPQSEGTVPNRKYLVISLLAVILVYILWSLYNNQSVEEETPAVEAVVVEGANPEAMPIVVEDYTIAPEAADTSVAEVAAPATGANSQVIVTDASFVEPAPVVAPVAAEPKVDETVVIKIKDETWVEVKDTSKLYISKVLKPGTTYIVPEGGKGMVLSLGKASGAEVYINGKLTQVTQAGKKTNIALDPFLPATH